MDMARTAPASASDPMEVAYSRAVIQAYSRQVPVLYVILSISAVALATSHWSVAPLALTLIVPGVLVVLCAVRLVIWTRRQDRAYEVEAARKALRTANVIGPVIGLCFLAWAIALFDHGDPYQKAHVIFFCGFTVVSCIFCQLHVLTAALGVTASIIPPLTLFLVTRGEPTLTAIGVTLAGVSAAMVRMLFVHSKSFREMIAWQVETKRLSDENRRLANLDSLTALPNRRRFFARLDEIIGDEAASGRFVIGVIDLDGFKPINDLYGHVAGDQVLIEVGARLELIAGDKAFICRLGGDEFAMILEGDVDDDEALALGDRICEALQVPFVLPGLAAKISASVGLVSSRQGGGSAQLLYERADYALYHAKQNQRGRAVMFSEEHETAIRRFGLIEQNLLGADLDAELSLVFQPIVCVATGRVTMFEALARWVSPEIGPVSPAEFVPIAERSELVNRMTQILFRKALATAALLPDGVPISFNLSARDLQPEPMTQMLAMIRRSGVAPSRIVFEITETAAMRDIALAERSLSLLRGLGASIALDDFGAGYSSLSHVRRLPLDKLKVDRDFIIDIETDDRAKGVMKSVIDLCRNLRLECVAEGVETERQRDVLLGLGCATMQGYLFSRPIGADALQLYLAGQPRGAGRGAGAIEYLI